MACHTPEHSGEWGIRVVSVSFLCLLGGEMGGRAEGELFCFTFEICPNPVETRMKSMTLFVRTA